MTEQQELVEDLEELIRERLDIFAKLSYSDRVRLQIIGDEIRAIKRKLKGQEVRNDHAVKLEWGGYDSLRGMLLWINGTPYRFANVDLEFSDYVRYQSKLPSRNHGRLLQEIKDRSEGVRGRG